MSEHPDELMQKYVEAMDQEPGWRVSDFVLMVGFERVQADGTIEHTYGVYEGENQSTWATHGLVAGMVRMRQLQWQNRTESGTEVTSRRGSHGFTSI
ncbi:Uncharacterised protein [Mycobacteroides abscessus subsp. massiliense]|uniref:DUF7213 family protein n=1 Tax=Mycobacteroides abscessus TaxID=36809 RepID=UPI0009D42506|nr:hypothetical protein [Mycobacteroides abscessus]SLC66628.1 Uncharacterised protein [Mycobacteroides abscessus subsp. massiliense]SLI14776.1 Uncharacterised protein [Mycobacteroides abscessus subsp. massiliense]